MDAALDLGQTRSHQDASMKPKRHFAFAIDIWNDVGDSIVRHLASIDNFEGACACYEELVKQWPAARIMLRQGARVVKDTGQRH
jgi:hypothetical protein